MAHLTSPARKRLLTATAFAVISVAAFVIGFEACLHLKTAVPVSVLISYRSHKGDAPPQVRSEVLRTLQALQEGYTQRDPKNLDSFMHQLFPDTDDILLIGTDTGEWIRGRSDVREFVKGDWQGWGDVRIAVDDSSISALGDVAWTATIGNVQSGRLIRPIRLTTVLTRIEDRWLFRELHFQYDDRDPALSDLPRRGIHLIHRIFE